MCGDLFNRAIKERNDDVPPKQHSFLTALEVTEVIQDREKVIMKRWDQ